MAKAMYSTEVNGIFPYKAYNYWIQGALVSTVSNASYFIRTNLIFVAYLVTYKILGTFCYDRFMDGVIIVSNR